MNDNFQDFKNFLPDFVKTEADFELYKIRHTAEHIFNQAVEELWPGKIKRAIGPAIENGFYMDGRFEQPINEEDFEKIEAKMREIVAADLPIKKEVVNEEKAREVFKDNPFKQELISEFVEEGGELTLYWTGDVFVDLCKGPHVDSTGEVKAFKVLKVAGAYWRGDEKNEMLTRIYGTAFKDQESLDKYLWQLEEAKKRDHKKIGKRLGLFMVSDIVGPGLPLFLPNGQIIRSEVERFLFELKKQYDYRFVWTPHIAKSDLYIKSKHWQKYDAMMPPIKIDNDEYTMKPMNCPHHFEIYNSSPRSYKDLPLRLGENATVYRFEKSGEVNGLLRVRSVTQDDSHWFVSHDMLSGEIDKAIEVMEIIYKTFGLKNYRATISARDKNNPDKYLGSAEVWDKAEAQLQKACEKRGINFVVAEGEAAFYGPKIDVLAEDSIGREWQLTTIQLDFNQPENFNLEFVNDKGEKEKVAVLHIAHLGSIERFLGIIIEEYAGNFPSWLSPVQVKIIPISDQNIDYADKLAQTLQEKGVRVEIDKDNERMQNKIRQAQEQKIPYMLIVGKKEQSDETVSLRYRDGEEIKDLKFAQFSEKLLNNINNRNLDIKLT